MIFVGRQLHWVHAKRASFRIASSAALRAGNEYDMTPERRRLRGGIFKLQRTHQVLTGPCRFVLLSRRKCMRKCCRLLTFQRTSSFHPPSAPFAGRRDSPFYRSHTQVALLPLTQSQFILWRHSLSPCPIKAIPNRQIGLFLPRRFYLSDLSHCCLVTPTHPYDNRSFDGSISDNASAIAEWLQCSTNHKPTSCPNIRWTVRQCVSDYTGF